MTLFVPITVSILGPLDWGPVIGGLFYVFVNDFARSVGEDPDGSILLGWLVDEGTEVKDGDVSLRADLIPTADTFLHTLRLRGHGLALVADGPAAMFRNNLGPYGLYELFDANAISEEVGVQKPDARMFDTAMDALGIGRADYDKVIIVGNNLARDIKGANQVGIVSV